MSSSRQEKLIKTLAKFPQTHIEKIIIDIQQKEMPLIEFYIRLNLPKEIQNCQDDFVHHRITYNTYYQTMRALRELSQEKAGFLSEIEENLEMTKESNASDLSEVKPITLYTMLPITRMSRRNEYWDIYNDVRDVHAIANREPEYKSFVDTTLKIDKQIFDLLNIKSPYMFLYLLANMHHHLNMHFDPARRWKLSSILDTFKETTLTSLAEIYIAKNLLIFMKCFLKPEFAVMIKNTDFEVMKPFYARLTQNFPDVEYPPLSLQKIIHKTKKKEWDYMTKLFNADSKNTKLMTKLFTKLAALDYFRDMIIDQDPISKDKLIAEFHNVFGKNIFDSDYIGKTHLTKRINEWDTIAHSKKFRLFQEEKKSHKIESNTTHLKLN